MKIAWVTPFNERSAIGKVSASITAALAQRAHEILIVASEYDPYDPTPLHRTDLQVVNWRDQDPQRLEANYDAIIVNVGDNYGFHAGVVDYVGRAQCIGIFHDFCIYHLFTGWLEVHKHGQEIREREIDFLYGEGSGAAKRQFFTTATDLAAIVANVPMTEWISRRCGAALAHARFYLPQLQAACSGPTGMAYLTQESRNIPALLPRSGELVVTTVGWINSNKCADVVIQAIAGSELLRSNCRYRLVGPIPKTERDRLISIAEANGFQRLEIVGEVSEAELDAELGKADILCCLRRPILEGASASAIEAMMAGRPVMVADAGFYAELPSEHVVKVPPAVTIEAVRLGLEGLVSDEHLRMRLGEGARQWAVENFSRDRYVAAIEDLVERFIAVKPYLGLSRVIGRELSQMGLQADDPAVSRVAKTMQDLFSPDAA
jgi:glycosyltransferase involved in cell wall biosynthesis